MTKLSGIIPKKGQCGICGGNTLQTYQCQVTGIRVGKCCLSDIKSAEALIEIGVKNGGPCHPDPRKWADEECA